MNITAQYDVRLQAFMMVCIDADKLKLNFTINGYFVEIDLIPDKTVAHHSRKDSESPWSQKTYGVNHLFVKVTHDENGDIDSLVSGKIELYRNFEEIAETGINRLIRFFKYQLNNPLLREVNAHDDPWSNDPKWFRDENEIDLAMSTSDCSRHLAYGYFPRFGMKALSDINDQNLQMALNGSLNIELYEEFLCNARTEIIEENYKRAVIEMAIACEVFVKKMFFSGSSVSGAVFDYLSLQRKIEVSVHELINKPAKEVFGESFKDNNNIDFLSIGYLFQARNRVVHSGHCNYKDDKGNKHEVDEFVLEEWWQAISNLIH